MTQTAVMVRPAKSSVFAKMEIFSIDDGSILGAQSQIVPDMIEMLFDGVIIQERVVHFLYFVFNVFDHFTIAMGTGLLEAFIGTCITDTL